MHKYWHRMTHICCRKLLGLYRFHAEALFIIVSHTLSNINVNITSNSCKSVWLNVVVQSIVLFWPLVFSLDKVECSNIYFLCYRLRYHCPSGPHRNTLFSWSILSILHKNAIDTYKSWSVSATGIEYSCKKKSVTDQTCKTWISHSYFNPVNP